jgi:RNA polymerase sigma-70 factor, ECF subfamily
MMTATEIHEQQQFPQSDERIAARIVAGEVRLFEILMRRHHARVDRAVRAVLCDDEIAIEDVMQKAFLRAFKVLDTYRGSPRFSTWLTRIALNEASGRSPTHH